MPLLLISAVLVAAPGCRRSSDRLPALGSLATAPTEPVRLGDETRPALTGTSAGGCRLDVTLDGAHLVLAFGWRLSDDDRRNSDTAKVRTTFVADDGTRHELARSELPPSAGAREGWLEVTVPLAPPLEGRSGALLLEVDRARHASLFVARPHLVPPRGERPNLVLLSIDTLRADRLGVYGHSRPTSPTIDGMARQGALFENALAHSAWTLPSHYTMMTSLYPSAHGVNPDRKRFAGIHGSSRTLPIRGSSKQEMLAERLAELGYFTAAITEGGWVDARFGFDQGFASYVGHANDDLVAGTQRLALHWLEAHRDLPFFLFLHTYQVHQPYRQPPPYDRLFADPEHRGYVRPGVPLTMAITEKLNDASFPPTPGDMKALRALYDGEIRYVDDFVAALLQALRRHGLDGETIVLLTSDHGEELFERGVIDHGETLHDEVMRVPFVLWGPGRIPAGVTVADAVGLVDILPTLVALAGGEATGDLQGESLVPLLEGSRSLTERPLFAEGFETVLHHRQDFDASLVLEAVWEGEEKLLLYRPVEAGASGSPAAAGERLELFDLDRDPGETRNLAGTRTESAARLRQRIAELEARSAAILETIGAPEELLDEEIQDRLRALGYL